MITASSISKISTEDIPFLIHDKNQNLISGIKVEWMAIETNTLHLRGWSLSSSALVLLGDGKELATKIKRFSRPDVLEAFAISTELNPGFELFANIPAHGTFVLRWVVIIEGVPTSVDFLLKADASGKPQVPQLHGAVDQLLDMVVYGWAWDPTSPLSHVDIELLLEDEVIGKVRCDVFREDLLEAGIGTGKYGYRWPVPENIDSVDASRIVVRIQKLNIRLTGNTTVIYSKLSATQCFGGEIDFSWPYYISGTIVPKTRQVPTSIEVLIENEVVSVIEIRRESSKQDRNCVSSVFSWNIPSIFAETPASAVKLRLPENILINVARPMAKSHLREGTFELVDRAIHGNLLLDLESGGKSVVLKVLVGSETGGYIDVQVDSHGRGEFSFAIPDHFCIEEEYSVGVCTKLDGIVLRTSNNCLQCKFRPKVRLKGPVGILGISAIGRLDSIIPDRRILGNVEHATTGSISGWAWDSSRPDKPVDLVLRVDGQAIGVTRANRFAARLRGQGKSGHQQFFFELPDSLQNGTMRQISVVEMDTGVELPNHTGLLSFPLVCLPVEGQLLYSGNYRSAVPHLDGKPGYTLYSAPKALPPQHDNAGISMIVLNWNGEQLLEDFLASLERYQPRQKYEILIVDHGSTDGSVDIIRKYSDRLPLRLLERRSNYSFSASNNYAARLASGEYLLFLNNDLIFQHDCAGTMAGILTDPDVAIVGARLVEPLRDSNGKWTFEAHHEGVRFKIDVLAGTRTKYYAPQEIHDIPPEFERSAMQMPAVTAALMMCRKSEFFEIGGFDEEYFYGMEDVDFCLKVAQQLHKKIVCDLNSTAIHNRSATRDLKVGSTQPALPYDEETHTKNRKTFIHHFGNKITRPILGSLLEGSAYYRRQPLRVTFAVTEADMNTSAGDYFTALELGTQLRRKFGWEVFFVQMGCYSIPGTDVLVVMRHDYNIRNVVNGNPGLVTAAWVRNRTDEWLAQPEFNDYQIIFASSQKIVDHLHGTAKRNAIIFPIATNSERFSPGKADPEHLSDVVFTGNYHGVARGPLDMMNLDNASYKFSIYGHNWENHPKLYRYSRGGLSYDSLSRVYDSSKLVIDDSHPVTRDWNSLNSRVFDAIASGKVVITNCVEGAKELFGSKLPAFSTKMQLNRLIGQLLKDDKKREKVAQDLRKIVLAKHTYAHRADTFKSELVKFLNPDRYRFAIKIGVPRHEEQEHWGDYHFALGLKRALERKGHYVRIDILPNWESGLSVSDDVVIALRGLSRYKPQPTAINLMWLISHPDDVSLAEMQQYDHVFVASESYAQQLAGKLGKKVSTLLQCTDTDLFYTEQDKSLKLPKALFVGNSRGQRRQVVRYAHRSGVDFGVYGGGWQPLLPAERLLGEYIPNGVLRRYYSGAKVLLNDHWPDMKKNGFISNRIFDAGACGALVLSDAVDGLQNLFGDTVLVYKSEKSFKETLEEAVGNSHLRKKLGAQLKKIIVARHTFDHRVASILACVDLCKEQHL
jgi:GT2 family glycosyltransferase/spore maturation protein CgeB